MSPDRKLVLLHGSREQTLDAIQRNTLDITLLPSARSARNRLLGSSHDVVAVDAHDAVDLDAIGVAHGLVRGGGALILRLDSHRHETRVRFHLQRVLERTSTISIEELEVEPFESTTTTEQLQVVAELKTVAASGQVAILRAHRGRGKSSALGMLVAELGDDVAYSATHRDAVRELERFADGVGRFIDPFELSRGTPASLIIVDEAAQLPVGLLRQIWLANRDTAMVFSTTIHGYEGTGRGFELRFGEWLGRETSVSEIRLEEPIRWAAADPLERFVFDLLLLDAEPRVGEEFGPPRRLKRDELVADEARLRRFFGLLVESHYKTSPSDLQHLLDGPNIRVHGVESGSGFAAANLVALEGELTPTVARRVVLGEERISAQAIPDVLTGQLGFINAARMSFVRSVRIAVESSKRRSGLASSLVEHTHQIYNPDAFGTLFSADVGVLAFRRSLGYEVVWVSAGVNPNTGSPSVLMLRPISEDARELMASLRAELAREFPVQRVLLKHEGVVDGLSNQIAMGLEPAPDRCRTPDEVVHQFAKGPRTFESAAASIRGWLVQRQSALDDLPEIEREAIIGRALNLNDWNDIATRLDVTTRAVMRALRRGVAKIHERSP